MKKSTKLLLGALLIGTMALAASCGTVDTSTSSGSDSGSGSTSSGSQSEVETAVYKVEYYLENDAGEYELDTSNSGELTGTVGQTVNLDRKEIEGYVFETDHRGNVLRGKVLADGTLVLKAYYSKDYTDRVTFETEFGDEIDLLKGEDTQLVVTVKVDGVAVSEGVNYSSSFKTVTVDENGVMSAKMRGEADISVSYKNVSKTFHATVYDAFIDSEEDWWAVYDHLSYWYKFTGDVVLSENTLEHFEVTDDEGNVTTLGYTVNKDFSGVIDGGGHSLTYSDARLFHWVAGTDTVIRNITLNASNGFYWGAAISYGLENGAVIDNVTLNASVKFGECYRAVNADFWIKLGGDQGVSGVGGMFGMIGNATVQNCTLDLDLTQLSDTSHFGAIAYQVAENTVIKNCNVVATDGTIELFRLDKDETTTVTDCSISEKATADYTVAYYLEGEDGFAESEELRETLTGYVGKTASVTAKAIAGYAFDADNAENVLEGEIAEDGSLVLRLYYRKTDIVFETETASGLELEKSDTLDLSVTVKENGEVVTEGIVYTSDNEAVATVADGVVTAVKGGTAKITVTYAGASREFEVVVWDKLIAEESDWWDMLTNESAVITGYYKLANDLTLNDSVATHFGAESYMINHTFAGVLEGNGHTLTYSTAKLFTSLTGTIQNITLNAGKDQYWGSAVAYFVEGATVTNVTVTTEFSRENTYWYSNGFIAAPGAGVFGVWISDTTFENCIVNVTLSGGATTAYYSGIGYEVKNSTINKVTVNTASEISLYTKGEGNTVTESEVKVEDSFVSISTEEEFWAIYASETTLAGKYRLANDITLTDSVVTHFGADSYKINHTFAGVLDGDGHTLTYSTAKLFTSLTGTIQNITLNAGKDHYWGSAVAYFMEGATVTNVTVTAEFSRENTYWYSNGFIAAPGAGVFGVWISNTTFENCIVNVTLSGGATTAYYSGIGYEVKNSTLNKVTVNAETELTLYTQGDGNTVTESEVKIKDSFVSISTEEEFWAIYASEETLAGKYRLANDITLTKTSCDGENYNINYNFTGVLDGNGHALTYTGARLFHTVNGTIQNITLNAGSGYYWGSAIAFTINNGAVLKNITVNVEFTEASTRQAVAGVGWLEASGAGGLCVWLAATVENCTVNVKLSGAATTAYYAGLAYDCSNSVLTNVTVNTESDLTLYKQGSGNTETGTKVVKTETAEN